MPIDDVVDFLRKNIPLIDFTQLSVAHLAHDECIVKVPFIPQNKNHVNSMYFGSMAIGTEVAAGVLAIYHLKQAQLEPTMVFKDMAGTFLKRAEGDTYFICTDHQAISDAVAETLQTKKRVNVPVHVIGVTDLNNLDEKVSDFTLTLSIKA